MSKKVIEIQTILQSNFGNIKVDGETIKSHVQSIDGVGIIELSKIAVDHACDVLVKRSGAGLTIIVKC